MLALLTITGPQAVDAGQAMTDESATEAVKRTITDLIYVLDNDTLKQPEQSENRRREIEEIIRQRVDYEEMAKREQGDNETTSSDTLDGVTVGDHAIVGADTRVPGVVRPVTTSRGWAVVRSSGQATFRRREARGGLAARRGQTQNLPRQGFPHDRFR